MIDVFFFFKQKTAYEMRISDWSSDVCSSDLLQEATAKRNGFKKVTEMKLEVARTIKNFCIGGGFLFAMCSGPETLDIALAANGTDIAERVLDRKSVV